MGHGRGHTSRLASSADEIQSRSQRRSHSRRVSVATGYLALGLLALTLLIGPANLLLRRRNPVSSYLRRDAGTWTAIASVVHVIFGLQVHGGGRIRDFLNYFVGPDGSPLLNSFGLGNWTGLAALVIVVALLATSSDAALRKLRAGPWKRLQRLSYALFALVILHAFFYGALLRVTSPLTLLLGLSVIAVFVGQAVGVWLWRRRYSRTLRMAICLALTLTGALVLGPRSAPAQDVASLQGTFVWDSTGSDDVAKAIEGALADLNVVHRRFARGHLQSTNQPYRTITVQQDEATVSIASDGGEPIRAPASGEPIEWTRGDGKRMRVSIARENGAIRQTFVAEDEERENLFRPSADGRGMTMAVTVRMDRLPDPIRYDLVYRRGEEPRRESGRHDEGDSLPKHRSLRDRAEDSRMRQYLWEVAGPWSLAGTFLMAGVDQLLDAPDEWDRNLGGYGKRVASRWGRFAVQTTVTHGFAAALDRPTGYLPCECPGHGQRMRHALLGTITDPEREGGRTLALPRIAGVYAGAFAELAWTPESADAGDALLSGTSWIVVSAIGNLVQEFLGAKIPLLGTEIPLHGPWMH